MTNCYSCSIILRILHTGCGLGSEGAEPYVGLGASPYPSTTVGFTIHPLSQQCTINGTYAKGKWEYAINSRFARDLIKLQPTVAYKLNPEARLNASLDLSRSKLMACSGLSYDFDIFTRAYMGIKGGFVIDEGDLYWKLGLRFSFKFHSFGFSLPITLGSYNLNNNNSSLLLSLGIIALGILSFGYVTYRDIRLKKYFNIINQ